MDSKVATESQKIAQLFVAIGWLIIAFLLVVVLAILLIEPSSFSWVIWFGVVYVLPLPLIIWGLSLFVRYQRFLKNMLKMSERRLWVETVIMNVICLVFFWFMFSSLEFPLTIKISVSILNVFAISLAAIALSKKETVYS